MPAVQIRVAPEILAALRRRAARHERSLEGLRSILAAIAREEPPPAPLPSIELNLSPASPPTSWRREEIYDDDGR
jgi:plasmid stability protein